MNNLLQMFKNRPLGTILCDSTASAQELAFMLGGEWDDCNGIVLNKNDVIAVGQAAALINANWCYVGDSMAIFDRLTEAKLCDRYRMGERYFINANLRCSNLAGLSLKGVNLNNALLNLANLAYTDLSDGDLTAADATDSILIGANLERANLARINLTGANLEGANLQGSRLYKACLQGACLKDANLNGANLSFADLRGANLDNVSWDQENLMGTMLTNDQLS
ncbi:pentapeptide repeat family protein [Chondrocystis sp. NIES-4102]|nr:pentapeptide repeat family protein [Chondrocystis sp. NIES-4102]